MVSLGLGVLMELDARQAPRGDDQRRRAVACRFCS